MSPSSPHHLATEDWGPLPLVPDQREHRRPLRCADLCLAAVEYHAESQPGAGASARGLLGNCPGGLVDDWRTGHSQQGQKGLVEIWWKHGGEFEIEKFGNCKGHDVIFWWKQERRDQTRCNLESAHVEF